GERGEGAGGFPRSPTPYQQHTSRRIADGRAMDEQHPALRQPPVQDLAKRRSPLPEGKLATIAAPEPCARRAAVVSAQLAEKRLGNKLPPLGGAVDGRSARAARVESRKRRRYRSGFSGIPGVDGQLRLVLRLAGEMLEGAAELGRQVAVREAQPNRSVSKTDRLLDYLAVGGRAPKARAQVVDRVV